MLENETTYTPYTPCEISNAKADFIIKFLTTVNKRAEINGAESVIGDLEAMKSGTPDEVFNAFIDPIIQLIRETHAEQAESAKIDKLAAKNNWSLLRKLVAQRGYTISSLSQKTGIAPATLSKHFEDGNFKYTHFMDLAKVLNIPLVSIEYYYSDFHKRNLEKQSA